jgi:hypothetical protein
MENRMGEEEKYKIGDLYRFYCNSGYVNATAEEDMTIGEITGYENQEQLDNAPEGYVEQCLEQSYADFMCNVDSGFYKTT